MFELFYYSEINKLKEDFTMKMPQISLLEWQKKYSTEKACAAAIARYRWPNGFMCPIARKKPVLLLLPDIVGQMVLCALNAAMIPHGSSNLAKYINAQNANPRFP
jgi:hypothetical protein